MSARRAVILGAGPTGLSAAYHLGEDSLLVERESRVGGHCRSVITNGFTFDAAGHIMFSNDPYVHQLYELLLGDNVHWQEREAWIYSKGVHTRYPFQGALYGLPPAVIKECLIGAIEARFGRLKPDPRSGPPSPSSRPNGNGHAAGCGPADAGVAARAGGLPGHGNGAHASGAAGSVRGANGGAPPIEDCCGDGVLEAEVPLATYPGAPGSQPANFEEFIYRVWGAGIARHFAIPYNRKLWAVPLSEMETSWLGGRVPLPDLEEMIEGALSPVPKPMGPNARFGYPLKGGFQALMDGFLPHLRGELALERAAVAVAPSRRQVTLSDGTVESYDALVSTLPLPVLVRLMGREAPPAVRDAAAGLRHVSVRCVNLGIGRPDLTEKHWIYYPEDPIFHRIFAQGNASPHCNPPGGFGLTCEITYSEHKPLPAAGEALVRRCIEDCRRVGIVGEQDPVWTAFETDLPYAYVVYDHERKERVDHIRAWMLQQGIVLAGRYSEWEYYNSDHAFLAGRTAARTVQKLRERAPDARPAMERGARRAVPSRAAM